ncbi:hypothetical protein ARMSODRAFT_1016721 [Armillaria solidipes]|uniref:SNF2 N-terminal domain-containing protein n=1 Tax=Armillaria solidipes TaxID=1076256 RepID=A0A2H3C6G5_9AGAR|nr:hypothetical protein ARMSODRAFT_1016721 [Armillaria solidipes]
MASATASTKVKVSGYAKRNNASAAVPLEIDSDPDFNPGAYIPEDTKKKNKKTKRASHLKSGSSGGKKRQRDSDDDYDVPKARKRYRPDVKGENPLLEFFNDTEELGLHSASEDETDDGEEEEEEDDDDDDQEEQDDDEPIILKSMVGFTRKTMPEKPTQPPVEDDSVTESDTDEDDVIPVPPSQALAAKAISNDDSVTEDDTEDEIEGSPAPSKPSQMKPVYDPNSVTEEDSVTEDDSDMDDEPMMISPHLKPRPGFPLASGQKPQGSLILDEAKGIKVPAAINTYLREYQRDGIKFFYRQYSEGRGGLLGDDMGLGKTFFIP